MCRHWIIVVSLCSIWSLFLIYIYVSCCYTVVCLVTISSWEFFLPESVFFFNKKVFPMLKPTSNIACDIECWHIQKCSSSVTVCHGWSHYYTLHSSDINCTEYLISNLIGPVAFGRRSCMDLIPCSYNKQTHYCRLYICSPAYGVYISQLIRYARGSSNYSDFLKYHLHLRNRLLDQGY